MVLAMYRVHSSMCMQGQMKEEYSPIVLSTPAQSLSTSQGVVLLLSYTWRSKEDAEIESTVNPRADTVVYHHYLELARDS